jgi:hypothetical protein
MSHVWAGHLQSGFIVCFANPSSKLKICADAMIYALRIDLRERIRATQFQAYAGHIHHRGANKLDEYPIHGELRRQKQLWRLCDCCARRKLAEVGHQRDRSLTGSLIGADFISGKACGLI